MKKVLKSCCLVLLGIVVPMAGDAVAVPTCQTTATFAVTATVVDTCTVTTTPLAFPQGTDTAYQSTAQTGTGSITVTCNPSGLTYTVALTPQSTSSTTGTGTMSSGGNTISYSLFQDQNHTTQWGNTSTNSKTASGGTALTVYGQTTASQSILTGSYTDTVNVCVTYS